MNYNIFKKLGNNKIRIEFGDNLPKQLFEKIVERCIYSSEKGGMGFKYEMKTHLKEYSSPVDYGYVDGKDEIKRYWQFGTCEMKHIKETVVQEDDIEKYGMKVVVFHDSEVKEQKAKEGEKRIYKYVNKYEILDDMFGFYLDLIEERRIESDLSFRDSRCMGIPLKYCVQLRFEGKVEDSIKVGEETIEFEKYFSKFLRWLFEEIQQTNFIISVDEKNNLLKSFHRFIKDGFYVEPVDVLRRNFFKKDGIPYVRENYGVSYYPEGVVCYLFITENFSKNVDGKIFIVMNDRIINTGREVSGYENSICEGYYNAQKNTFVMTDILYYRGDDVRKTKFFVMGAGTKEKMRHEYMYQFFRECIQKSTYIVTELREEATKIYAGKYLFGSGSLFEDNINELFDKMSFQEYPVAGIMFRPMADFYHERSGHWYECMRWRYQSMRTVDFLVNYVREGKNDKVSPFQLPSKDDQFGRIIYYKTLKLMIVGASGKAVDFNPRGGNQMTNIANVPLHESGRLLVSSGDEIENGMVVSFLYQRIYGEYTNLFRWTPIAINYSKTALFHKKMDIGLNESYGNHLWNALNNPITETNLKEGSVPEEDLSSFYYIENANRIKKYPFQIFHNRIIKDRLISGVCPAVLGGKDEMAGSLLDLACGNGGDTSKWRLGKLKTVVGIDISKDNIDGAIELYKRVPKPRPDTTYIWGDCSKLIFPSFNCAMDTYGRVKMEKTFLSKNQFDVVSLQYAVHYFFEDEILLRSVLQNVSDNLKVGGHFIGTSLDGGRVYKILEKDEMKEGKIGDDLLWKIRKEYDIKKWDGKKPNMGHQIEVFVKTIGISHKEYLVNYDFLRELCGEYGLEMVEIRGFEESYLEALDAGTEFENDLRAMSAVEKEFSFLHNQFKFIKKRDADDSTFKKLMTMIQKKIKKEGRTVNLENKKFTIKIRKG